MIHICTCLLILLLGIFKECISDSLLKMFFSRQHTIHSDASTIVAFHLYANGTAYASLSNRETPLYRELTVPSSHLPNLLCNRHHRQPYIVKCERRDDFIQMCLAAIGQTCNLKYMSNGYSLTELSEDSLEYQRINGSFQNASRRVRLRLAGIQKVMNPFLLLGYELKKLQFGKEHNFYPLEELLYHGTKIKNVSSICENNFNWRLRGTAKGHLFGQGVSFSPDSIYASNYGDKSTRRVMFLSKVLVGRKCQGYSWTIIPPEGFDTTTKADLKVYVKYEDNCFYPTYIIHYLKY